MEALRAAGYSVCNVPLIAITARQQARVAVQQNMVARCDATEAACTGHMFVSASAVRAVLELAGYERLRALLQNDRQYWLAAGAGTMQAVRVAAAAVGAASDDWQARAVIPQHAAQYDSEHLWAELENKGLHQRLQRICIYRGEDMQLVAQQAASGGNGDNRGQRRGQLVRSARQYSRNWFADTARAQGMAVDVLTVYQRSLPQRVALPSRGQSMPMVWVWSSSLAIANWEKWRQQHTGACYVEGIADVAICTHPRIAQRAVAAGFRTVYTCLPEPQSLLDVLDALPNAVQAEV